MVNNEKDEPTESKTSSEKTVSKTVKKEVKFNDEKISIHKHNNIADEMLETGKLKVKTSIYTDIFIFLAFLSMIALYAISNAPQDQPDQDVPKIKKKRSKSGKILVPVPPPPIDYTKNPNCGLVLSMSTIPRQGYGVFAIKNITKGEILNNYEVNIPSSPTEMKDENTKITLQSFFEYLNNHDDIENVHTQISFGSSLQSHPYIQNVDSSFKAMNDISPGTELFFETNEQLKEIFDKTDDIIKDILKLIKRSPSQFGHKTKNEQMYEKAMIMLQKVVSKFDPQISALLPTKTDQLFKIQKRGSAYQSLTNKTHHFLQANGKCIDKIEQKPSLLVEGQNGAFAQRDIEKGELITPALLYAIDKKKLEIYDPVENKIKYHPFINYCFGHSASSVLLCHVSSAALINHKPLTQNADKNECQNTANSVFKWSDWNFQNRYSKKKSPTELYQTRSNGRLLTIDFVATRDIKAGEEIFFDYGDEWEKSINDGISLNAPIAVNDEFFPLKWINMN